MTTQNHAVLLLYFIGEYFQPGKWTKICSLHFPPEDFYNFESHYRTLKENAVPSIFPYKSAQQVKCRSTHNSNKPEEMTEDASDSDEMQVEEAVAHCTSCQHRISELEKTVAALQEQVKQFSRKFDESRAENNESREQ